MRDVAGNQIQWKLVVDEASFLTKPPFCLHSPSQNDENFQAWTWNFGPGHNCNFTSLFQFLLVDSYTKQCFGVKGVEDVFATDLQHVAWTACQEEPKKILSSLTRNCCWKFTTSFKQISRLFTEHRVCQFWQSLWSLIRLMQRVFTTTTLHCTLVETHTTSFFSQNKQLYTQVRREIWLSLRNSKKCCFNRHWSFWWCLADEIMFQRKSRILLFPLYKRMIMKTLSSLKVLLGLQPL